MTENRDLFGVLDDLALLYEVSLSVGQSLELRENCDRFLRTLMSRKNLDSAFVWIRARGVGPGWTQVYANPTMRATPEVLPPDHPLTVRLVDDHALSVSADSPAFATLAATRPGAQGTLAAFRLGDLGFLELYSTARSVPFDALELGKLRNVMEKFSVSLQGCLDHERLREEEERRRELELQMLHAQKLESLGLLAGGVAHDFNNLLTAILVNAELLRPAVSDAQARESVAQIIETTQGAADLCSQLLAYSGRGKFLFGPIDLNGTIEEMLRLTQVTVSKKAGVTHALQSDLPAIEGDTSQIRQVVLNLVTNASEALGDESGTIRLATHMATVGQHELADFHLAESLEPGEYVCLEVRDSGCGIDEAAILKLFDPFYTTKFTGRGLGLAAVLGIVRGHHGAICVRSRPGEGTLVRVLFPPSTHPAPSTSAHLDEVPPPSGSGTILVVDDEPMVRGVLGKVLREMGFDVIYACDGGQGWNLFRAHAATISLVILDVTMPVMDGTELFDRIVRMKPDTRVVMMSGYATADIHDRFRGARPSGFLKKPFRAEELQREVQRLLEEDQVLT